MAITHEKFLQKQATLLERTARALNLQPTEAEALLRIPRQQSLRLNTLIAPSSNTLAELAALNLNIVPAPWCDNGYFCDETIGALRDSPLPEQGSVYIQNAASWLPVLALAPQPHEEILDMCAAPGGKTSHLAQMTNNQAIITANDNSRPRLHKLQRNLERLGVANVTYALHDASRLAGRLPVESFDKILLDAPCSGEGMMTLDDKKAFESWSPAHIKRLQALQKRLIVQAWQLLKPGGTLVYSTCTMAPEENEAVVDYLLRHNNDCQLESLQHFKEQLPNVALAVSSWNNREFQSSIGNCLRLTPSQTIEAFFVAKLTKQPSAAL